MNRWRLVARAAGDLTRAGRYSRRKWGAQHADRYLAGLEGRFDLLARNPHAGPARDDIKPGLRWFPYKAHVIYYRIIEDGVRIVRILHHRRNPRRLLAAA